MPISDDLKKYYPDDWEEIRERVLERATDGRVVDFDADFDRAPMACSANEFGLVVADTAQCEWCGKPQGWSVFSYDDHWEADFLSPRENKNGNATAKVVSVSNDGEVFSIHDIDIEQTDVVLTIAHLCQDPRCDDLDHLRALCQRCRLQYDNEPEQKQKRERIQAELRGQQTLGSSSGCPSVVEGVEA